MRHNGWLHWRDGREGIPGPAQSEARKLLADLDAQRKAGGYQVASGQKIMDDGTVVEAKWVGAIPQVKVSRPGQGGKSIECALTLEAGFLDLGESSAATFADQPVLSDAELTIYQTTSTLCGKNYPMGQMRLVLTPPKSFDLSAQCSYREDNNFTSVTINDFAEGTFGTTRLEKMTCQAWLPPSLWTGLMQQYVEALYGSISTYKAVNDAAPVLVLPCLSEDSGEINVDYRWGETWGLIRSLKKFEYFFAIATPDSVILREAKPNSPCALALQGILQARKDPLTEEDIQLTRRLEAFLLSTLRVGPVLQTVSMTGVTGNPLAYGWKFNVDGTGIAVVTWNGSDSTALFERALDFDEDLVLNITEADSLPADLFAASDFTISGQMYVADAGNRTCSLVSLPSNPNVPADWDAPVYCFYKRSDNNLIVVRSSFVLGSTGDPIDSGPITGGTFSRDRQSQEFTAGFYTGDADYRYVSKIGLTGGGGYDLNYDDIQATWVAAPNLSEFLHAVRRKFHGALLVIPTDSAAAFLVRERKFETNDYTAQLVDEFATTFDATLWNLQENVPYNGRTDGTLFNGTLSPEGLDFVITGDVNTVLDRSPPDVSIPVTGPNSGATYIYNTRSLTPSTSTRWYIQDDSGLPNYYGAATYPYSVMASAIGNGILTPDPTIDIGPFPTKNNSVLIQNFPSGVTARTFYNFNFIGWA